MAIALAIAIGGMIVSPYGANASIYPCTKVVGQSVSIDTHYGAHIGSFYQGYDQCHRNAYSEIDFADTWVASQATGTSIDIYHELYSNGTWYVDGPGSGHNNNPPSYNNPGYPNSWASPAVTINYASGNQRFRASFVLTWWSGSKYTTCSGISDWDYTNGTAWDGAAFGSCS